MLRVVLFFLFYMHSQGQCVKLLGKVDIETGLASVFHDIVSLFLDDNPKKEKTEIDVNKLVNTIHNFENNKPSKEVSNVGGSEDDKKVEMLNLSLDLDEDNKPKEIKSKKSNADSDDVRTGKRISSHKSKNRRHTNRHRYSTKGMMDEDYSENERREKRNRKDKNKKAEIRETERESKEKKVESKHTGREHKEKKTESKHVEKEHEEKEVENKHAENKKIEKKVESDDTGKENKETKAGNNDDGKRHEEKQEKSKEDKKGLREKTILEEIIGMVRNVHVYGKHEEDKHGLPLNNIKV